MNGYSLVQTRGLSDVQKQRCFSCCQYVQSQLQALNPTSLGECKEGNDCVTIQFTPVNVGSRYFEDLKADVEDKYVDCCMHLSWKDLGLEGSCLEIIVAMNENYTGSSVTRWVDTFAKKIDALIKQLLFWLLTLFFVYVSIFPQC